MPPFCGLLRSVAVLLVCAVFCAAETVIPGRSARVVDEAELFTAQEAGGLENMARFLETKARGQVAILTIPKLEDESLAAFSMRVSAAWKVALKTPSERSVLLIVSLGDKEVRIETGGGWKQHITDNREADIVTSMVPYFREGNYAEGTALALNKLAYYVAGEGFPGMPKPELVGTKRTGLWIGALLLLVAVLVTIRGYRHRYGPVLITPDGLGNDGKLTQNPFGDAGTPADSSDGGSTGAAW